MLFVSARSSPRFSFHVRGYSKSSANATMSDRGALAAEPLAHAVGMSSGFGTPSPSGSHAVKSGMGTSP